MFQLFCHKTFYQQPKTMSGFPTLNYCEYNENNEVEAQWHERIVKFLADMQEYLLTSACPQLRNQSILHMENFREYVGLFLSRDPHEVDISYSARLNAWVQSTLCQWTALRQVRLSQLGP